ncbi:hypothetical protein [Bdellovibrio svalbardensis]|uniref:Lipoprotein n=1 Tax=Bdellovibrio svalbardensis TaxID=2972972 RepID=A0ABT6DHE4_9BACT|nr:hypothetical protein [Bdellovibrio svalbardensis]MDG0815675.1 hypothetical protein [Bdellovibrio svalbardensis]
MKKSLVLVLMLVMAGCSFSKHDKDKKEESIGYNTDIILQDYKLSNFDKTIVAIKKNDSILFYSVVNKLSKNEINSLTENGLSLAEIALQNDRYDFFRDLLKAGLSPFLKGYLFPSGVALGAVPRREYAFVITGAVRKLLGQATDICNTGDIRELIGFMDTHFIPPTQKVCGENNLFQTFLIETANPDDFGYAVMRYLKPDGEAFDVHLNEILFFALTNVSKKTISAIDRVCKERSCNINQYRIEDFIQQSNVVDVLNSYEALLVARSEILLAPSTRLELPAPPPPGGRNEPYIDSRIAGGMPLLSYMKGLIENRLGRLSVEEAEPFAERAQSLGLKAN